MLRGSDGTQRLVGLTESDDEPGETTIHYVFTENDMLLVAKRSGF